MTRTTAPSPPLLDRASRGLRWPLRGVARRIARRMSANVVSVTRVVLLPGVLWLIFVERSIGPGIGLYVLSWLLDILDGAVAAERQTLGKADDPALGELVDTVCDKVFVLPLLGVLAVTSPGWVGRSVLGVVLASELMLLVRRWLDYRRGVTVYSPLAVGKIKVWLQAIGVGLLLVVTPRSDGVVAGIGLLLLAATLPINVVSLRAKLAAGAERSA
ncbi:MAG: CDP-alcohol phosphatidyltransferase family protein [Acidobacteriota bacterium]